MNRVVYKKLDSRTSRTALKEKRVVDEKGKPVKLKVVDTHSDTLGSDLTRVFTANVASAIRSSSSHKTDKSIVVRKR